MSVQPCGLFTLSPLSCSGLRIFPNIQLLRLASFASVVGVRGEDTGVEGRSLIGDAGREAGREGGREEGREGGRDGGRLLGGRLLDLLSNGLPLLGGLLSN